MDAPEWKKRARGPLRVVALCLGVATGAPAQTPPLPAASEPSTVASTPREAELEARVRQLESMVNQLATQVQSLAAQPAAPAPAAAASGRAAGGTAAGPAGMMGVGGGGGSGNASDADDTAAAVGGSVASRGPLAPPASNRFDMPSSFPKRSLNASFGPGFELMTDDEEFQLQFHDLTQIDYRGYEDTPINTLAEAYESTFGLPRQWWIFSGRMGKPFEYFLVPAFGFDSVNLLDAFLNVNFDPRLQLKIGRYKTPFTYEFYNLPINGLVNPERSLFFNNFGLNRDVGMMAWGSLFDKRFDYAVGIFNGDRNFFIDRNSSKDVAALLNFRPFGNWKDSLLENFSVGGSVLFGNEFNRPIPQTLRTNVATTGSGFFGVPFLQFNNGVVESGDRALWDLHAAWYYNHTSLIAEWGSGFQDYAQLATPGLRTQLPISGYYVQMGHFLTGETVAARGQLKPLRNFDIRKGKRGPGAIELAGRYSTLNLGREVFTSGFADPNLWTNDAYLIDVGVNWYWSQFVKVYLGWQHAAFGNPVFVDPGNMQLTNDMAWARFQIAY